MVDIIIPLGNGSHNGNEELKMLLRSIEKHLKGYDRVFLVTQYCPEWIDREQVTVVNINDPFTDNKDANLHRKTLMTVEKYGIDGFVWCADDNCFLQDIDASSIPAIHNHRPNSLFYESSGIWRLRVRNTLEWAKARGVNLPHNMEAHCPQYFDGKALVEGMKDVDYVSQPGLTIHTCWHVVTNTWQGSVNQMDVKHTFELEFDETITHMTDEELCSKMFIGYNDQTCGRVLKRLHTLFPTPSKYEKENP